jgi:F-type H+-transporting ATPase subunit epsilon
MQATQQYPMKLTVLTPTRRIVEGVGCSSVHFPSTKGVLGILPEHADLVCALGTGLVYFDSNNTTTFLTVSGGVAKVDGNSVTLLADTAEDAASIDVGRAQRALERAREQLTVGGSNGTPEEVQDAVSAQARALARIEAATLHSAGR